MLTIFTEPHLRAVERALKNKRTRQFNRWVDHNMSTGHILGYQNEIRWGFKTGYTYQMCDEAQHSMDRFESEREVALGRLNRTKAAARPGTIAEPEVLVDDW